MPHLHYMKVKIKTMAEEARIIRKEEQKQMGWINFLCQKQSFRHGKDEPRPDERKWPEAKENAQEMSDAAYELFWGLREHRVQKLRREARINHLAYGFLRGVKYSDMEKGSYDFPKLKEIEATAKRFATDLGDNSFKYMWDHWVDEAKKHFEETGNLNRKREVIPETATATA